MLVRTKMTGLMLAVAVMLSSSIMVYANEGMGEKNSWHQGGDWHQHERMMAKVLNLTEDQKKQMKDVWQKEKVVMKTVFEQMKSNEEALNEEIVKPTPDMNKINAIQAQLKTIQGQMVDNRLDTTLQIKKILTPEQFTGYMTLEKAKGMMHGHDHHFGHKDKSGHDEEKN